MNRRRMFQTLALAPVGALLSQEAEPVTTPDIVAAEEFIRVANRTRQLMKGDDALRIRDSRVESAQAFATMTLFLKPDLKSQMESDIRSWGCWWQSPENLAKLYERYGVEPVEAIAPDVQNRESAIAFLDDFGIGGFLDGFPQLIHPDQTRFVPRPRVTLSKKSRAAATQSLAACGGGNVEDGFFAAAGLVASSLGIATMMGCLACGPIAAGIGFGLTLLRTARTVSCMGSEKK